MIPIKIIKIKQNQEGEEEEQKLLTNFEAVHNYL